MVGWGHGRACNSQVCHKQTLEPARVPLYEYRAEIAARVVLRSLVANTTLVVADSFTSERIPVER